MTTSPYTLSLDLNDFRQAQVIDASDYVEASLLEGEIMVRVDRLALTANSISYGFAGKAGLIRYLDIYPATMGLANLPCWGYGDIIASNHPDIAMGNRVYGFLPIATHIRMQPDKVTAGGFTDVRVCRSVVPPFYNEYAFTHAEPGYRRELEDLIMLFRPLFGTSFLMQSYCDDNSFHGASRIIVTSASAKTAMGFGYLLKKHYGGRIETVGLTSDKNRDFVISLQCYDSVLSYEEVAEIKKGEQTLIFDVAGNANVVKALHMQLGDTIPYSGSVGKTHWDVGSFGQTGALPGAKPIFWSAPDQIAVLRERMGSGAMMRQMSAAMTDLMMAAQNWMALSESQGHEAITRKIRAMLDGHIGAHEGVILRP